MTTIPTAEVLVIRDKFCKVRCPYCRGVHEHSAATNAFTPGSTHHRAPGCGMHLNPDQRVTGYRFTIAPTQEG